MDVCTFQQTIKTNVMGTLNMLGLAKRVGARSETSFWYLWSYYILEWILNYGCYAYRILLTSTSEVYGDPLVHPQDESYWGNVNPIGNILWLLVRLSLILIGHT